MAIITISRGTGSGGKILAECIAKHLDYNCIAPEVLVEAGKAHNVPYELLKKALDKAPGLFDRQGIRAAHYLAYIREELVKEVKDEKAVYYGLAGQLLLRDAPHVLRVFVIANVDYRIESTMQNYNCTREKATEIINKVDKKRDKWVKHFFNIDRRDPLIYDVIINLDHISIESACETISTLASQKEFMPTPESQKRMEDLLLSTSVRSKIAENGNVKDANIEVDANDGVIILRGTTDSTADADKIRQLVLQLPNVKDIKSEMHVKM